MSGGEWPDAFRAVQSVVGPSRPPTSPPKTSSHRRRVSSFVRLPAATPDDVRRRRYRCAADASIRTHPRTFSVRIHHYCSGSSNTTGPLGLVHA